MARHKISKFVYSTWSYYICRKHGRYYSTLEEVERDHSEGYVIIIKRRC